MDKPKYTRDLNMIVTDPNPQKSYVMMGQKGKDPLKLYVGDHTPEGDVLEEIGERTATFLPPYQKGLETQRPAYTRTMGDNPRPTKTSPPKPGSSRQEMADWSQKFLPSVAGVSQLITEPDAIDDFYRQHNQVAQQLINETASRPFDSYRDLADQLPQADEDDEDDDDFIDTSGL